MSHLRRGSSGGIAGSGSRCGHVDRAELLLVERRLEPLGQIGLVSLHIQTSLGQLGFQLGNLSNLMAKDRKISRGGGTLVCCYCILSCARETIAVNPVWVDAPQQLGKGDRSFPQLPKNKSKLNVGYNRRQHTTTTISHGVGTPTVGGIVDWPYHRFLCVPTANTAVLTSREILTPALFRSILSGLSPLASTH